MFGKYLIVTGAVAGAMLWSAAAVAAPGETTGTVNLRSGPGTAYAVVGRVPAGAQVNILSCRRWCELGYAGEEGYASPNAVVAEYPAAPFATDSYPMIDDFYDQNEPDNWSSLVGAHNHGHGHDHNGTGHSGSGRGGSGHGRR